MVENSKSPLVSVLMTAYNREKFIIEAIESVLASSYTNFELIIVDDCSSDKTVEISRSYEKKDQRIQVYVNERNLGDYPNRNRAASYAKGKYIKYVDADDMIYPWGLDIDVTCMENYPDAGYGLDSINQDSDKLFPIFLNPVEAYRYNYFKNPIFNKAPTSCIIKTEIFLSSGGFSGKNMLGDFEYWLTLSQKNNVLLMPHGIVWCRIHEEQESEKYRNNSVVPFEYSVIEKELINSNECPINNNEKAIIINRINKFQSKSIMRSLIIERKLNSALLKIKKSQLKFTEILRYLIKSLFKQND